MILRPDLDHLRLATVLAHATDGIALELWLGGMDPLVVSRRPEDRPDLSSCELRWLVAAAWTGGPAASVARWVHGLRAVAITGAGVAPGPDGVWRVEGDGPARWTWPTTLPSRSVALVLADAAVDVLADGTVDAAVVERCGAAVRADHELGVSVVSIEEPARDTGPQVGCLAARLAARCRVEELLHDAERTIRNGSAGL